MNEIMIQLTEIKIIIVTNHIKAVFKPGIFLKKYIVNDITIKNNAAAI